MNHAVIQKLFCEHRKVIEKEIKIRTHSLINSGYFYWEGEFDDVSSKFRIKAFHSLNSYNSKKGTVKTYIKRILERKSIDLIRQRITQMRQCSQIIQIEEIELGSAKIPSEFFYENFDFNDFDLDSAIVNLPQDLQIVCRLLSESYNATEISKILKKNRRTITKRIMELRSLLKNF